MKLNFRKVIISSAIFILCSSVQATEPKLIGEHGDWAAYTFMENNSKVCYMVSHPKKTTGNYTKRGDVFAFKRLVSVIMMGFKTRFFHLI